jgi:hypothetical protein
VNEQQKAGYHAFSVLGTDGKNNIRPSNPVLVVVRKPAPAIESPVGLDDAFQQPVHGKSALGGLLVIEWR